MHKTLLPHVGALLSLTLFMSGVLPPQVAAVIIPAATPVSLKLTQDITSDSNTGDSVQLVVASDVRVGGQVAIPVGSTASGTVLKSKKENYAGLPGEIAIQVNSIQTPSGTTIPISLTRNAEGESKLVLSVVLSLVCCLLFLLMKGKRALIPAGTLLSTTTMGPIEVKGM